MLKKSKNRKKFEKIKIDLSEPEGNAFYLIKSVQQTATKLMYSAEHINILTEWMHSSTYVHLLAVLEYEFGRFYELSMEASLLKEVEIYLEEYKTKYAGKSYLDLEAEILETKEKRRIRNEEMMLRERMERERDEKERLAESLRKKYLEDHALEHWLT